MGDKNKLVDKIMKWKIMKGGASVGSSSPFMMNTEGEQGQKKETEEKREFRKRETPKPSITLLIEGRN